MSIAGKAGIQTAALAIWWIFRCRLILRMQPKNMMGSTWTTFSSQYEHGKTKFGKCRSRNTNRSISIWWYRYNSYSSATESNMMEQVGLQSNPLNTQQDNGTSRSRNTNSSSSVWWRTSRSTC
jgi:hypothetical protein